MSTQAPNKANKAKRLRGTSTESTLRTRLTRARGWIAGGVVGALVLTVAIVSSGFDAQEVTREEPNVWVAREAGQYARVNTETGEIDTVRKVSEPSGVLQIGSESVVLSNGNGKAWPIDASLPADFVESSQPGAETDASDDIAAASDPSTEEVAAEGKTEAVNMPDGTRDVLVAGNYVLLRTETGAVYIGTLDRTLGEELATQLTSLQLIDPLAEEAAAAAEEAAATAEGEGDTGEAAQAEVLGLRTDAIALAPDGTAALYSASDGTVWRFDATRGSFVGEGATLPAGAQGLEGAQLALVAGGWVLLDTETSTLWRQGGPEVELELTGDSKLQASGEGDGPEAGGGAGVLIADVSGLWRVPEQGAAERIAEGEGTPAQPRTVDGVQFAAWIGQNGGTLWSSDNGLQSLAFDESAQDLGEVSPVFYTNGERAVLGEARTGMLWTLPDGELIPLSQWTISDPPKEDQGTVVVDEVTDQVPPTAVDDKFGVRAGEPAPLPLLLNDFDPNKRDVLTIVPESLAESPLPEAFGVLEMMPDGQSLMIRPNADASGSATFTYRVLDGALSSEPATVTVTVVPEGTNTPPAWCAVDGCQREWAVPPITPGGTLVYPILEGWIDPEGDPMMLAGVELMRPEDPANAIVTADGRLAVRHTDVNAGGSEIMLRLKVRDGHGEEQQRDLQVSVISGAAAEFAPTATTVQVDVPTVISPLDRVAGGSGAFQLTDVTVQSGSDRVKATGQLVDGTVEITGLQAGGAILSLGIRDTVTGNELTGFVRVTATPGTAPLTLPPLRAFVRPFSDSTVEILTAIPGAASRAVSVQAVNVVDGELRADVIAHTRVRVAGTTPDGGPGRVGAVDVTVAEGAEGAQGRLTVFQVPESGGHGAVAVADSATVRAGSVVDIRVLDNDVAAPGERLILHPQVTGSGTEGELAFASGSTLRYLAPTQPGTYRLNYTTYGASTPEAGDVGTVTVNVLPRGANQNPTPSTVTVRVAPGEQSDVQVPLSGVDPDGDRVRLTGVNQVDDPQLTASISPTGAALQIVASAQVEPGLQTVEYSVRDGQGGTGTGTLRIIVTSASDAGAPIVSSDYVRLVLGAEDPVAVRPLNNDIDPARGALEITEVVPNVPGGEANPDFAQLTDRLDLSKMKQGEVSVAPDDELGTVSYKYTVKSSESQSTSDGLLLVQTSERVGSQAPTITDTVLNVRERAELSDQGVDVITDKVRWAAGDPDALELSLWGGNKGGYSVSGNSIVGDYNPDGDLVAFRLKGVDSSGQEVSSYGFLIIPPLDELRITLKVGLAPLSVDENKTVNAKVRSFLDLSPSDRVELGSDRFPVGRAQATCEAVSENEIRYSAGEEAPWDDTCLVSVRLVGQKNWTQLPVPVMVVPRAPLVQLTALTRTVAPGASETIELADMVQWQGGRAGDLANLNFAVSGGGSLFDIVQADSSVTVSARADVTPGSQEGLTVQVAGQGESQAPLTLRIGEAPKDQPRGGTVNLTCTIGSSCATDVIGAPGEYDPFAGKRGGGLTLETVSGDSCSFGTVSKANDRGVTVSWPDNRGPGGRCTVGYTVRDAQGNIGEGSIELDAQGVPRAPASVSPQSYTGNSVTFVVALGAAQNSHPAVTGVEISGAGSGSCSATGPASYQCVVTGLENGVKHQFSARAVNAVGASEPSSSAEAWAYRTPEPPTITKLEPIRDDRVTQDQGVIEFSLEGGSDVAGYRVTIAGVTKDYDGRRVSNETLAVPVGGQQFSVVSLSRFEPPSGGASSSNTGQQTVKVAGSPIGNPPTLSSSGEKQLQIIGTADPNFASQSSLQYYFTEPVRWHQTPQECRRDGPYQPSDRRTFDVNNQYATYNIRACVTNGYGFTDLGVVSGSAQRVGGEPVPVPTGLSYSVATEATVSGVRGSYAIITEANPTAAEGMHLRYRVDGVISDSYAHTEANASDIFAQQCADFADASSCSEWAAFRWTGAPTIVRAELTDVCVPQDNEARKMVDISAAALPFATSVVGDDATGTVTITWGGSFSGLKPLTLQGTPCNPPEPEPEPATPTP
ncbi:MAG: Ig-like domain-containing protein [Leucobacter sp.]